MEITEENIEQELSLCLNELTLLVDELQGVEADTPDIHEYLRGLDDCYAAAVAYLPEIILFVGRRKPQLKIIGDIFLQAIAMSNHYLTEKTRIANNTPDIYLETNDLISLN